jgi:cytochrome c-type biogenesis protein CcmH
MFLWIVMAVLTAAASLSVLVPLYRARAAAGPANHALAIYRDQLGELDRDVERGLIGATEATAARTEIARRLLKADEAGDGAADVPAPAAGVSFRLAALAAIVAVPAAAIGLYLYLGSPDMPDMPLQARLVAPPEQQDIAALVARVETHLAANPEDGRGWELLGPVYQRLGRNEDAQRAFANALRLLGSTAEREASLGEAISRANGGVVTAEARAAFERALALDSKSLPARFFLALAMTQEGRKDEALAAWRSLLADAPPGGAPWAEVARQAVAELEGAPAPVATAPPGPTAGDVEAAAGMSEEDRMAMIGGMVDSLSARLAENGADADGWARLIRSYMVLGRKDDATAALGRARTALAGDAAKLAVVENEAKARGLIE